MRFTVPPPWRSRGLFLLRAVGMVVAVGLLIDFLPIDLAIVMVGVLAMAAQVALSGLRHRFSGAAAKPVALPPPP